MNQKTPVVSVIVPCYNQAQYLAEAVESVLAQSYSDWECIIVNDGSPDNTKEVAHELLKSDNRISYYKKENSGISDSRNFGIHKAKGIYILPLDSDDKIAPAYLAKAVGVLQGNDVVVVYCDAEFFGVKDGKWKLDEYSIEGLAKGNLIFSSALFKKVDFLSVGGYNINMKYGWEDWDFWIAILKSGGRAFKIPEILFYYRIKEQSRNTNLISAAIEQKTFMQLYLNHQDFFDEYYPEPVEIIPKYRDLKHSIRELQKDNNFLKGIIKLKRSSYITLLKRYLKR